MQDFIKSERQISDELRELREWVAQLEQERIELSRAQEALRHKEKDFSAGENKYQVLFNTMAQGVVYQAADGRIIDANPAAEKLLGLPLAQLQGRTLMDFCWRAIDEDSGGAPGDEHPSMVALRTGCEVRDVVMGICNPEHGDCRWLNIRAIPQFLPGQTTPYQVYSIFEDNTEQKRVEKELQDYRIELENRVKERTAELSTANALMEQEISERQHAEKNRRDSEERFRLIFDNSLEGVLFTAPDGSVFAANSAACNMLGWTEQELCKGGRNLVIDIADPRLPAAVEERRRTGRFQGELSFKRRNGEVFPVEMSSTLFTLHDGEIRTGILFRDISDRKRGEEALRESEKRHRLLFEEALNPILLVDENGHYIDANETALQFMERDREKLIGRSVWDFSPPEIMERQKREHSPFTDRRTLETNYLIHERVKTLLLNVVPMEADEGRAVLWGIGQDITERKQIEEALREQRDFSESLIETAQVIILVLDTQGCIIRFNSYMEQLVGYTLDEVKGMDWFETFLTPEIDRTIKPLFQKTVGDIHISGNVNPIIAKDGRTILVEWYNKTLKDKDGRTVGVLAIGQDITEREQAENNLRMAHEKLLTILDSIDSTVYVADMNTHEILFMNQKMVTVFGGNKTGDICYSALRNNSEPCECCTNNQLIDKDGNPAGVCIWHDRNPVTGRCYINYDRAIEWTDGRLVRMQIATDITDQKNMETQLQQAQKMEAIGTLAGGIAHDFNNILGAILGYAEMAQEDSPAGSILRQDIDQIVKAGHRARELVKQILAFSRQGETEHIALQPAFIIQEAMKMLRSSLPSTITIKQNIDMDAGLILASPTQIHQIVMNLCTNAFHAMEKAGGTLAISLEKKTVNEKDIVDKPDVQPGDFVQLSIGDSGTGIAPELWDKIFDPYFTTKEVGKGTGMGLAIIHGIVKSYGGCVSFNSQPGKGTVFEVLLPVMAEGTVVEKKQEEIVQCGNERILFIDDEEFLAEMSKSMLERLGYQVTIQSSSLEGLTIFQNQPDKFDLVITDQTMPGMTGSDLARRILQIRPFMPIILCTGYSSIITEKKAKSIGIKGFAMKPLAWKSIALLIREVLDGGRRIS